MKTEAATVLETVAQGVLVAAEVAVVVAVEVAVEVAVAVAAMGPAMEAVVEAAMEALADTVMETADARVQDAGRLDAASETLSSGRRSQGITTAKALPRPGSLSTETVPPIVSRSALVMKRPMPDPP